MSFQPLPWHDELWQMMMASARQGALAHAFLLKGVSGVGKLHFAKAFAGMLLCEANGNEPCQRCKGCSLVQAGNHPDLLVVEPEEAGRPIKIGQVRALNDFAQKTAQQGGRRIIIINPAEAMNINASNALLKSLEEPGAETLFLLVSHRAADMLPTIRSRCQVLSFATPGKEQALSWLMDKLDDSSDAGLLLNLASGSPLLAYAFFGQGALQLRRDLIDSVGALFKGELTPVEVAKEWQGRDYVQILEWLASWLEDSVKFKLSGEGGVIKNDDLIKLIGYLAGKSDVRQLIELRDLLVAQRQILLSGGNLNTLLVLEGVFCRYLGLVL